ncbi:MaoC-like dehydratase [Caballeronia hypogeia]|uniref:MaoC-like dehydratase n=1 Tax=Caballeronia hypogeia TaxID=1777140 RepID=A0A158CUJ1_9BURK|nr:MaoC family dehydratase [Caballeronia hypogeia]SAK85911.1 MaoC-like dehydratase [Caballeronia hypogeia]
MKLKEYGVATLEDFVGKELGVTEWVEIDQSRIDAFAACTGDHQWIHVDVERARRESPFGGTIAHGYLLLSLLASHSIEVGLIPPDAQAGLNYGLDKVRFLSPVKAGARVRSRIVLASVERKGNGSVVLKSDISLQIEGQHTPALAAQTLAMLVK